MSASGVFPKPLSVSTEDSPVCCRGGMAAGFSPPRSLEPLGTHFSRDRPQGPCRIGPGPGLHAAGMEGIWVQLL